MTTPEKELKHCTACNQMTNHSGETCLKHTSDIEWTDTELYIDLAPEVSHRITAREGVLTNRLQMKAGEIVGLKELLSSHTTYWKERVRKASYEIVKEFQDNLITIAIENEHLRGCVTSNQIIQAFKDFEANTHPALTNEDNLK